MADVAVISWLGVAVAVSAGEALLFGVRDGVMDARAVDPRAESIEALLPESPPTNAKTETVAPTVTTMSNSEAKPASQTLLGKLGKGIRFTAAV